MATLAEQPNGLSKTVNNGVQILADLFILPGTSQAINGKLGSGLGHAAVGIVGGALLGPVGWIATGLNSYTKSLTEANIWNHIGDTRDKHQQNSVEENVMEAIQTPEDERTDDQNALIASLMELADSLKSESKPRAKTKRA